MVKANHLDACLIENECPASSSSVRMGPGKHTRVISSSASSVASSSGSSTNPLADWSTITCSSSENTGCSDLADKHWHSNNKHDLIHAAKLASIPNSGLTTSSSSSLSESFEDEEQIKLLCGDDNDEDHDDWPEVDTGRKRAHDNGRSSSGGQFSTRRRRIFPKLVKLLHKFRRKLNWQLFLFVAVLLVVFLSMSQLNEYQYRVYGIAGWDVNTTRETAVYVVPGQHTATLEPRVVDRGKRYLLLVIVCSAVENFSTRQTIRQTWANGSEFNYQNYFHRLHSHAVPGSYSPPNRAIMRRVSGQLFAEDDAQEEEEDDGAGDDERGDNEAGQLQQENWTEKLTSTGHGVGGGKKTKISDGDLIKRLQSQVIFLVGQPQPQQANATQQLLVEESAAFGDMLQEDFVDTYNNLTLKSLMLLKWINAFNADANRVKFVMKCDDDTFLNLPNLMHVLLGGTVPIYEDTLKLYTGGSLQQRNSMEVGGSSLMGFLFRNAKPIRDVTSKWYAPKYMYRKRIFPNYLSGTGYVIEATRTAKDLYKAALHTPIFHLEDVYVTGLCASHSARTQPHHNPLFSFLRYANRECALRGMITQHPLTANDIRVSYDRLVNDSNRCDLPSVESLEKVLGAKSSAQSNVLEYSSARAQSFMRRFIIVLVAVLLPTLSRRTDLARE